MAQFASRHFLTGCELSRAELLDLLDCAENLRLKRYELRSALQNKNVALLFEKPSLRTRVSFTLAVEELGGNAMELSSSSMKKELPGDTVRVLEGYVHAVMLRTHHHDVLTKMTEKSSIPIINGLSDTHHPCQALADILTLRQCFGKTEKLKLAYVGDGNNVLHSLLLLAPFVGIDVTYACPQGFQPNAFIVKQAMARAKEGGAVIRGYIDPVQAVKNADAIYTDVWTSMGFETNENDENHRDKVFYPYQLNEKLFSHSKPTAVLLHCMPMIRGKEITDQMADHANARLFQQSENRLHAQKALLMGLLAEKGLST